jgi:hypothetical protein
MSCLPIIDVVYPPTYVAGAAASAESSSGSPGIGVASGAETVVQGAVPNPGAGCSAATGVIRVAQRAPVRVRLPIKDELGNVYQDAGAGLQAEFYVREAEWARPVVRVAAESIDSGYAIVEMPGIRAPGLYVATLQVCGGDTPLASTRYWVEVSKSFKWRGSDPLSISEVRMEVRDQCGSQNELLDRLKFTDDQIAWAIRKPVDEFNSTGQPSTTYTPANFPSAWRSQWAAGAVGYLLRVASIGDDRDGLRYQAGGVSVDDGDVSFVAKMSQALLTEWRDWVRIKKVEINVSRAYGSIGSDYGSGSWG